MDKAVNDRKNSFIVQLKKHEDDPRIYFSPNYANKTDVLLSKFISRMKEAAGMKVVGREKFVTTHTNIVIEGIQEIYEKDFYNDSHVNEIVSIVSDAHKISGVNQSDDFSVQLTQDIKGL